MPRSLTVRMSALESNLSALASGMAELLGKPIPADSPKDYGGIVRTAEEAEACESALAEAEAAINATDPLPSRTLHNASLTRSVANGSSDRFTMRKSGKGNGEYQSDPKAGKTGIASLPFVDSTSQKVKVKVKDRKTGVEKLEDKTQYLRTDTINIVGPVLAAKPAVRFIQCDEHGKPLPKSVPQRLDLTTAESGCLMLGGELSAVMVAEDKTGSAAVVFTPFAKSIYLAATECVKQALPKANSPAAAAK